MTSPHEESERDTSGGEDSPERKARSAEPGNGKGRDSELTGGEKQGPRGEGQEPGQTPGRGRDPEPEDGGGEGGGGWKLFARDLATSVVAVLLLGGFLFAISGVWPPMVAIESGSMEPNMAINDLAFVMDSDRFQPEAAGAVGPGDTGIVTADVGDREGYTQFGNSGDVIVFEPDGRSDRTPIIHRAMFWVEAGEDWTERADPAHLNGATCGQLSACPAPHSGFITMGDDNPAYDQAGNRITEPVKPEWVVGTAEMRIPWLGWFRLQA